MDWGRGDDGTEQSPECDAAAAFQRAISLHEKGRLADAENQYRAVLNLDETHVPARDRLGVLHMRRGDFGGAVALFRQALEHDPAFADAHNNLGVALSALKRPEEAAAHFAKALSIKSDFAEAHNNLGNLLRTEHRYSEAIEHLQHALASKPGYADAHRNIGLTLYALGRHEDAIAHFEQALAVNPTSAEVLNDVGAALIALSRDVEAAVQFHKALALKPDFAAAYNNLGQALHGLCRYDEAITAYERALAIRPDYAAAQCNEALARLVTGDFASGWLQYEWRWLNPGLGLPRRNFPRPLWLGGWDVSGKTILLHAEQGLGDTLQFVRYVPLVARLGGRVVLVVQPPLVSLLATIEGAASLHAQGDSLPEFDCHCPFMSLPLAFGTTEQSIPAAVPYLKPPASKILHWRTVIERDRGTLIGLVWSGSSRHPNDRSRSIPLQHLLTLLDTRESHFIALQKEVRESDAKSLAQGGRIMALGEKLQDFTDTAAIISLLDLVITVDTAVAHLAGAMGKPVWILLPFSPDWRWLRERSDSPWYPTARLFRQPTPGDWVSVVREVKQALTSTLRA